MWGNGVEMGCSTGGGGLYRVVSFKSCLSAKIKVEKSLFSVSWGLYFLRGENIFWSSVAAKLHLGTGVWVKVQDIPQRKKKEKIIQSSSWRHMLEKHLSRRTKPSLLGSLVITISAKTASEGSSFERQNCLDVGKFCHTVIDLWCSQSSIQSFGNFLLFF